MVNAMKLNLTRAIGVSNFNTTHLQDLDADLYVRMPRTGRDLKMVVLLLLLLFCC